MTASRPVRAPLAVVALLLGGALTLQGQARPPRRAASPPPAEDASGRIAILHSVAGIPPDIVGVFEEPVAFARARSGQYFVLDRRAQTVYGIDRDRTAAWRIVQIGHEEGHILQPTAFAREPVMGTFAVADRPGKGARIQVFAPGGSRIAGFRLPDCARAYQVVGTSVANAIGSVQYTGHSVFLNQPETGALMTEYSLSGEGLRSLGALRRTGQEADEQVHLCLRPRWREAPCHPVPCGRHHRAGQPVLRG
jgi:hypothetical protein